MPLPKYNNNNFFTNLKTNDIMANVNENAQSSATQCNRIAEYLKNGFSITSLEALNLFGCMRLASRICDLRERGYNIGKKNVTLPNGKRVCEYFLAR
jgi:ribosomal protein L9